MTRKRTNECGLVIVLPRHSPSRHTTFPSLLSEITNILQVSFTNNVCLSIVLKIYILEVIYWRTIYVTKLLSVSEVKRNQARL